MKRIILTLVLSISMFMSWALVNPHVTEARGISDSKQAACQAIGGSCDSTASGSVSSLLSKVLELMSWIVGFISILMIIIGGMKYILSNGDPAGTKAAQSTVIYSLVGLAVAALAQVLVRFVLGKTEGF